LKGNYSEDYKKQILGKMPLIFNKSVYNYSELLNAICVNYDLINKSDRAIKLVRSILNWCEEKEILTEQQLIVCRKKLKNPKYNVDNYVPTDNEIKETLKKLNNKHKLLYLIYLCSGIRKIEGKYLLKQIDNLKIQKMDNFVKINMNFLRKNKNSYFCYLPLNIYKQLTANAKYLSVSSIENFLKDNKLIPIKYCRKWFYTKYIELGVPESIVDYYQGRTSNSIGNNHYLNK